MYRDLAPCGVQTAQFRHRLVSFLLPHSLCFVNLFHINFRDYCVLAGAKTRAEQDNGKKGRAGPGKMTMKRSDVAVERAAQLESPCEGIMIARPVTMDHISIIHLKLHMRDRHM